MSAGAQQPADQLCHGTCIARRGHGALLRGPAGSGKSDLALRFLDQHPDAWLVADDQVALTVADEAVRAGCPATLTGLLEVRGLGIVRRAAPALPRGMLVALIVDLVPRADVPRIAEPRFEALLGVQMPVIRLAPFEQSAPQKLALALETIGITGFPGDDGMLS